MESSPRRSIPEAPGSGSVASRPGGTSAERGVISRIWLECSSTHRHDMNTGIQRVVRNIVNAAAEMSGTNGVPAQGLWFDDRLGYQSVRQLPLPRRQLPWEASSITGWRLKVRNFLQSLRLLDATQMVRNLRKRGQKASRTLLRRWFRRGVLPGRGEVLLLVDCTWDPEFAWQDLYRARQRGALIGVVVYDLIPLERPEFVDEGLRIKFLECWKTLRATADFMVCISRSVADDVARYEAALVHKGWPRIDRPVGWFTLGSELDALEVGASCRPELTALLPAEGPREGLLMVGSINPRKNHDLALDACELCWQRGGQQKLIVAGGIGWECASQIQRLREHPELGRRLFWFPDLADHELDYCYRRCQALVTPSLAEGFNLPIVEALSRGATVLASDLPVHREVGRQFAGYFPTDNPAALAALIDQLAATNLLPGVTNPAEFRWPNWKESCRELLAETERLAGACR